MIFHFASLDAYCLGEKMAEGNGGEISTISPFGQSENGRSENGWSENGGAILGRSENGWSENGWSENGRAKTAGAI